MKKLNRFNFQMRVLLFLTVMLFAACNSGSLKKQNVTPEEAKNIAKEAYLWGIHPVAIYHFRYTYAQNEKSTRYAGVNRIQWDRKPMKALPRIATTPNGTTLYGSAMLDFSKEPVVITVPEIDNQYWSVQLCDNYAKWWLKIGSQFTKKGALKRLLVGPNWTGQLPKGFYGADIVTSPSDFSVAVIRIALTDDTEKELKHVNSIQDRITIMPLSQWEASGRKEIKAEDMPITQGKYPTYPGMDSIKEPGKLRGMDYMRWISLVLNDPTFTKQADGYKEINAFKQFERIGLKAGTTFDPSQLTPEIKEAIEKGIDEGRKEAMALMSKGLGVNRNGWDISSDIGIKDTDWVKRAFFGILMVLGPVPSQSHNGGLCNVDTEGRELSGKYKYTITFNLNDMPPVSEFWEMPLYDPDGFFYDNPLDRYTINSYMLKNGKLHTENGKLVIYVQHEKPKDPNQLKNWLPAPVDGFHFTARFYGPQTPLIDGSYNMPGVVRTN